MSRQLPESAVDILNGKYEATRVAENLQSAYWLHGRDNSAALLLVNLAHDGLAEMADAMGYTIAPKIKEAAE